MDRQGVGRFHQLRQPQGRDLRNLRKRGLLLRRRRVPQAAAERIENRVLRMPADAENERKAELRLVGIVRRFKRRELRVRQAIQPGPVLLRHRIAGQARRALGLVGKVGMRLDQGQAAFARRVRDHAEQRLAQGKQACKRTCRGRGLGDPRRVLEDVGERGSKLCGRRRIQVFQSDFRDAHDFETRVVGTDSARSQATHRPNCNSPGASKLMLREGAGYRVRGAVTARASPDLVTCRSALPGTH